MLNTQRILLDTLNRRSYTFKPTNVPISYMLGSQHPNIVKQETMLQGQNVQRWIDIARKYCPQILNIYTYERYQKQYDQQVCLIDTQLKFKDTDQPGVRWTLLKSKDQINQFTKKRSFSFNPFKNPQEQQKNNIFNVLATYTLQNKKQLKIYEEFIEQLAPHDKWNLKILGQYKVRKIQTGGVKNFCLNTVCRPCSGNDNFYLSITTQNILISEQTIIDGAIEEAIPYTYALQIDYLINGDNKIPYEFVIGIRSGKTLFTIVFNNLFDLLKFAYTYNSVRAQTPYFEKLRFQSFSPERKNNWAQFYNDGESYFSDLHDQIQAAKKKICMTGWCITPYLMLKRPQDIQKGEARLDKTLQRAAKRGVKIFIVVFQQPSLFVNNDSYNVWRTFQNMSQNFKVLRHPGLIIPQLWSHHQKSVIIDQKVAFMGGLDICYGRWDRHDHPINDAQNLWQGADYNNQRQRSITQPRNYANSNLDRKNQPRMPWHDIAMRFRGPAVIDLQRHFVQYWYFAIRDLSDDPKDYFLNFKNRYYQLKRQHRLNSQNQQQNRKQRQKLFSKKNPTKQEMEDIHYLYVNQKHKETHDYTFEDRLRNAKQSFYDLIQKRSSITSKQVFVEGFNINSKPGNLNLQLCRSSCSWSTGINTVQHSIYNAYLQLITNSQEFIYIENQFFMSYQNDISERLAQRIIRAYRKNQKFKVIVMMPLLPGFQGDVTQQSSGVLRVQMQIQYEAISRHKSSIFQIVQKQGGGGIDISNYISFFGVRNHALFGQNRNIPKTEIIYVHSKLMIVDDRFMIIGSANINDRSLLGSRDSQLAMVIQDPQGKFGFGQIFDFRCRIFDEHFGMNPKNCADINGYWKRLKQIANKNTLIYRQVFGCIPDDTAIRFGDVARLQKQAKPDRYLQKIGDLYGHYVEWPINFLKEENLSLKFGQKQFLAPITFFT